MISIIAAMAKNRVIGKDNDLPWDYPEDMAYFREKTKGKIVIMGRKNFESFGAKPLKGRMNIVITSNLDDKEDSEKLFWVDSIDLSLEKAKELSNDFESDEIFVIGGETIYKQFLEKELVDKIFLNVINKEYEGDTYFPVFDETRWSKKVLKTIESNGDEIEFRVYERA